MSGKDEIVDPEKLRLITYSISNSNSIRQLLFSLVELGKILERVLQKETSKSIPINRQQSEPDEEIVSLLVEIFSNEEHDVFHKIIPSYCIINPETFTSTFVPVLKNKFSAGAKELQLISALEIGMTYYAKAALAIKRSEAHEKNDQDFFVQKTLLIDKHKEKFSDTAVYMNHQLGFLSKNISSFLEVESIQDIITIENPIYQTADKIERYAKKFKNPEHKQAAGKLAEDLKTSVKNYTDECCQFKKSDQEITIKRNFSLQCQKAVDTAREAGLFKHKRPQWQRITHDLALAIAGISTAGGAFIAKGIYSYIKTGKITLFQALPVLQDKTNTERIIGDLKPGL